MSGFLLLQLPKVLPNYMLMAQPFALSKETQAQWTWFFMTNYKETVDE
jgi:hypothetical protein